MSAAPELSLARRLGCLERSPIPSWVTRTDPTPKTIWANPSAAKLWRAKSVAELLARDISDMSETTRQQSRQWIATLRAGARDYFSIDWTIYPLGVPTHMTLHLTLELLDDGGYGLLAQAHPRQLPLGDELVRNAEAVRHVSALVALVAPDGTILSRNPAAAQRFGVDSVLGDWLEARELLTAVLELDQGELLERQLHLRNADGSERSYALEARGTRDVVTGEPAVLVHMLDESARVGAEREVEALARALSQVETQRSRWQTLVDNAPDLIMLVDRRHRIEFANRGLSGVQGGGELIGQQLEMLLGPSSRARVSAAIEGTFTTRAMHTCTMASSEYGGARQLNARLSYVDGGSPQVLLIASDVTEQRALEQELRRSQKLDALGTLASGIAHDFNNLVTIILGACDMAELTLDEGSPERELFDEVAEAGERAASLTRQMLSLGRKRTEAIEPLELNALILELTRLLTPSLGDDIELVLDLESGPCWLLADRSGIEQILLNLSLNARDAMPEGGQLRVSTRRIHRSGPLIELGVLDTGEGMSREVQARMFEPFFTTKPVGKGTGLGLSMVHNIVEQCGAAMKLDSTPGAGTRVRVRFPAIEAPQPAP